MFNLTQRVQLTIQNAASIFGRTLPNLLADKIGSLNVLIVASFGTGVLIFAMFGIKDNGGVIVFSFLYGFFSGAGQCSTFASIRDSNDTEASLQCCHSSCQSSLPSPGAWMRWGTCVLAVLIMIGLSTAFR